MKQPMDGTVEVTSPTSMATRSLSSSPFRLADSLPQQLLDNWRSELKEEAGANFDTAMRRRIELYLDQGYGQCYLKHPAWLNLCNAPYYFSIANDTSFRRG